MKTLRNIAFAAIALLCISGAVADRFYETWPDWDKKFKGEKAMPDDWDWGPDVLEGYESKFINMGEAFDGPARCCVVRYKSAKPSKKAYLYVHGFNDYFFQAEKGREFADSGINFYAVDLRRYGRSRLPWQYPFNVRDQKEYFTDIDSALAVIRRDGNTDITLSGHSTGGLTVSYYAACRGKRIGVNRVVTDSPFLEWNFSAFMRNVGAPIITFLGKITPESEVKQAHCDGYAYSLLKEYDGEWTYNTNWKMIYSPPVKFGWVGAITTAQKETMKKGKHIAVPIMTMTSSRKISGCNFTPEFLTGDAVLDPEMLQKRGRKLGPQCSVCVIDSGLHNLVLSPLPTRRHAYDSIFHFIRMAQN